MTEGSPTAPAAPRAAAPATPPLELIDRKMWWLIILFFGTALFSFGEFNNYVERNFVPAPPTMNYNLETGASTTLDLTVVTGDMKRLTCASDKDLDGVHCAFVADKHKLWPRTPDAPIDNNFKEVLQPYRTLFNNQLVLVSGVWATPEVAMRVHTESPDVVPVKREARFTALCKVKILGKLDEVGIRWEPSQQWYTEKNVVTARVESCTIDH